MKTIKHLLFWIVVTASSVSPAVAQQSCDTWNSKEFFSQATVEDIERCVQGSSDPEAGDERGRTPLHFAVAFNENPDVITRLVKLGADPGARAEGGWTPLHTAARLNANPDVIVRLIELGVDGKARTDDGRAAWDMAQNNEALQGTDAWWLLNDFRFK